MYRDNKTQIFNLKILCNNLPSNVGYVVEEFCQMHFNDTYQFFQEKSNFVYLYVYPLILLFGIMGNTLSLFTMKRIYYRRKNFRNFSICLAALSLADIMVLLFGLLRETIEFHIKYSFKTMNNSSCKAFTFINYVFSSYSAWIHVFISIERYVACIKPFHVNILCSGTLNQVSVAIIFLICVAFNLIILAFNEIQSLLVVEYEKPVLVLFKACEADEKYVIFSVIADYVFYFLMPIVFSLIFSTFTFISLVKSDNFLTKYRYANKTPESGASCITDTERSVLSYIRRRSSTTRLNNFVGNLSPMSPQRVMQLRFIFKNNQKKESESIQIESNNDNCLRVTSKDLAASNRTLHGQTYSYAQNRSSNASIKLTFMLISLPIFFILTVFPITTLLTIRLFQKNINGKTADLPDSDWLMGAFTCLMYINKALNIFLYIIFGKTLRRDFVATILSFLPFLKKCVNNTDTLSNPPASRICGPSLKTHKRNLIIQ